MASGDNFYGDHIMEKLMDCLNDAIDDFLSFNNPKSCCEKLEILLTQDRVDVLLKPNGKKLHQLFRLYPLHHVSLHAYMTLASAYKISVSELLALDPESDKHQDHVDVLLKPNGKKLHQLFRLYPLHHVSLHAYMTLASAYKISVSELLALDPESDKHQIKAFSMSRKSAAYSLLLAGANQHLLESESSLIVPVSNFWTTAGETLLSLVRSSAWNLFSRGRHIGEISFSSCQICGKCTVLDRFRDKFTDSHDENAEFAEVTSQFLNCVTDITPKIWDFLVEDCGHLKVTEDPINFRWLGSRMSSFTHFATHATTTPNAGEKGCGFEAEEYHSQIQVNLFLLGIHCLIYGAFLSTVCFSRHSPLMSKVESIPSVEGILNG